MTGSEITKWVVRGGIGLAFAVLGSFLIGRQTNITINFGGQPATPAPPPSYRANPSPPSPTHGRKREDDSHMGDILREESKSNGDASGRR